MNPYDLNAVGKAREKREPPERGETPARVRMETYAFALREAMRQADQIAALQQEIATLTAERDELRQRFDLTLLHLNDTLKREGEAINDANRAEDALDEIKAEREAHAAQLHRLTEALQRIVNASYTELRPIVEHYSHDPTASPVLYPDAKVIRSHATEAEWALVRQVAKYFQDIGIAALASVDQGTETQG